MCQEQEKSPGTLRGKTIWCDGAGWSKCQLLWEFYSSYDFREFKFYQIMFMVLYVYFHSSITFMYFTQPALKPNFTSKLCFLLVSSTLYTTNWVFKNILIKENDLKDLITMREVCCCCCRSGHEELSGFLLISVKLKVSASLNV